MGDRRVTDKQAVVEMIDKGLSVRQVAKAFDIATQRVYQILAETNTPAPTKRHGDNGDGESGVAA